MIGGDDIRYCGRCRKNVYNLSEMTEAQVQELVQGPACVRFYARADGTVVTSKCPPMLRAARRRALALVACLLPLATGFWGSVVWLHGFVRGTPAPTPIATHVVPAPPRPMMGTPPPSPLMGKPARPEPIVGALPPIAKPRPHLMGRTAHPTMGEPREIK